MNSFLQVFLYINVLVIGALLTLALQHAYAHFHPHEPEHHNPAPPTAKLPQATREHLLEVAEKQFQHVLEQSAGELQSSLQQTTTQLSKQLDHLGNDVVGKEMERFQTELADLRAKAEAAIGGAQAGIAEHQETIKGQLAADVEAEKQRLLAQIDTKLADAVATFLSEALPHNVDLGAQSAYLTGLLEEHKADFSQELGPVEPAAAGTTEVPAEPPKEAKSE